MEYKHEERHSIENNICISDEKFKLSYQCPIGGIHYRLLNKGSTSFWLLNMQTEICNMETFLLHISSNCCQQ